MTNTTPAEIAVEILDERYPEAKYPQNQFEESGLTLALARGDVDATDIQQMILDGIDRFIARIPDDANTIADEHYAGYTPPFPPTDLKWAHLQQSLREVAQRAFLAGQRHEATNRIDTAHLRAIEVVTANYGEARPDGSGDAEVYLLAKTNADAFSGEVDSKYLLGAALALGHLDSDGILAMLREAAR